MNKILYIALTAAIFAGCSKENPEPQGNRSEPISFEMSIAPQQAQQQALSRAATDAAFTTTWEDGDQIGLFAVRHAVGNTAPLASTGNFLHNEPLTYNATTGKWVLANPLFMPAGSDQLDFYAYYPYDAAATDPTAIAFKVSADQNALTDGQSNFNRSDLMFSNTTKNIGSTTKSVPLTFTHQMAMVQVAVSSAYDAKKVTIQEFFTSGSADISSGFTTKGESESISMFCAEKSPVGAYAIYRALVPAQSISSSSICITSSSGKDYNSPDLTSNVFTAGSVENYTIKSITRYAVGYLYPNAKAPIGVVFWVNPNDATSGKIVGLTEATENQWGPENSTETSEGINSETDGATATKNLILARQDDTNFATDYPAFEWVYTTVNRGNIDGRWYIPAVDELRALYGIDYGAVGAIKAIVNLSLANIDGAAQLSNERYWSSTQHDNTSVRYVNFDDGEWSAINRKNKYSVRAISTF